MFNAFNFFIALDTNLMNGKPNKVLENLYWLFLAKYTEVFVLTAPLPDVH